jgi:hypothetical protein
MGEELSRVERIDLRVAQAQVDSNGGISGCAVEGFTPLSLVKT